MVEGPGEDGLCCRWGKPKFRGHPGWGLAGYQCPMLLSAEVTGLGVNVPEYSIL